MARHDKQKRDQPARAKPDDRRERPAPASFTGDVGGGGTGVGGADLGRGGTTTSAGDPVGEASRARQQGSARPEPPRDLPRTATDMTPGIPEGSGRGIDQALGQPDSDIGGAVAGDTTPGTETAGKPSRDVVRREDKERTTL